MCLVQIMDVIVDEAYYHREVTVVLVLIELKKSTPRTEALAGLFAAHCVVHSS